jgi:hypothetical protein
MKNLTIHELKEQTFKYENVRSQESFLTRELKASVLRLEDLVEAYNKKGNKGYGWLLGNKILA